MSEAVIDAHTGQLYPDRGRAHAAGAIDAHLVTVRGPAEAVNRLALAAVLEARRRRRLRARAERGDLDAG